jgi:hypothetical protein
MAFIKTAYSAVLLAAFAAPAAAQTPRNCWQYSDDKERRICELEERVEKNEQEQKKRLEEVKRWAEWDAIYAATAPRMSDYRPWPSR